jgi:predicted TIM-barrel fold metal-dependent hydrolase
VTDIFEQMPKFFSGLDSPGARRDFKLLPDPEPREEKLTIFSVDDHFVEAPDTFVSRVPGKLRDEAPVIVEDQEGNQLWSFDGKLRPQIGLSAVMGRAPEDYGTEPTRFDEMRKGCWDAAERVRDMDLNGVRVSVNFPSDIPGFAGTKFASAKSTEVGKACVRAWNDWVFEEWVSKYPDRFVANGITYLADIDEACAEVLRNARRGFRSVSLPELMEPAGLPSLNTGYWDPLMAACQETDTVINLHCGSSTKTYMPSSDAAPETVSVSFPINAQLALIDWLYSKIPIHYPKLRIVLSEGGGGWVPGMMDRIDAVFRKAFAWRHWAPLGHDKELHPNEVLKRNFWFCAIDEPFTWAMRHEIGVDNLFVETDYPHGDSSWPDTQSVLADQLKGIPDDEVELITWRNASRVYNFPVSGKAYHAMMDSGSSLTT